MDLDAFLVANRRYARTFDLGALDIVPARRLVILTCMDARLDPLAALGLGLGDAHVLRNAGGRAKDALRSIALSCELFAMRRVLVVHHTECGLEATDDQALAARFAARGVSVAGMEFLAFRDLEESVREDVALLRASPLIAPDVDVDGLIYDVRTGLLGVVADEPALPPARS